jgi:hypothetical protein
MLAKLRQPQERLNFIADSAFIVLKSLFFQKNYRLHLSEMNIYEILAFLSQLRGKNFPTHQSNMSFYYCNLRFF